MRDVEGRWSFAPGSGGLVTALAPVLRDRGGTWIGWPGIATEETPEELPEVLAEAGLSCGYTIKPVSLTQREVQLFYEGFSNEILWPLFHEFPGLAEFLPDYWEAYRNVNRKYAAVIAEQASAGDILWVHDYQLMLVAEEGRQLGIQGQWAFFLHIPFPAPGVFLKLPWRYEILRALLAFDQIGVQTAWDKRNLLECLRIMYPELVPRGRGRVTVLNYQGREIRLGDFPISIDYREFVRQANSPKVVETLQMIRRNLPERTLILGVDRLDYTKGIPYRLEAFRRTLQRFPDLHGRVTLVQVVVPSRVGVKQYQKLQATIERTVSRINGEFTRPGWVPIHYIFRSLSREELLGYYRAADVALVTPLKDGMNLVAKEYCASQVKADGVLILSEFAGAAAQLQHAALMVNPFHVEQVAAAIHQACTMSRAERQRRMRRLRRTIRKQDVFWWVDTFLLGACARDLSEFPQLEEYQPVYAGAISEGGDT